MRGILVAASTLAWVTACSLGGLEGLTGDENDAGTGGDAPAASTSAPPTGSSSTPPGSDATPPSSDTGTGSDTGAGNDTGAGSDTGAADTGIDTSVEIDTGIDTGVDTGVDTGTDTGIDTGTDAGIDTGVDAGDEDTGTDAGVDTGVDTGVDSGTDAGTDSGTDSGVVGFCNGKGYGTPAGPLFCADFDTGSNVATGFSGTNINSLGSVSYDTVNYSSAPRSMHSHVDQGSQQCTYADLNFQGTGPYTHLRVQLRVYVPSPFPDAGAFFFRLGTNHGNNDCSLMLGMDGTSAGIYEEGEPTGGFFHATSSLHFVDLDTWVPVQLDQDLSMGIFTLMVGSQTWYFDEAMVNLSCVGSSPKVELRVGAYCHDHDTSSALDFSIDDVVLESLN